jgi:hypothetical protein
MVVVMVLCIDKIPSCKTEPLTISSLDNLSPWPREWRCLHHPKKRMRVGKKMINMVQLVGPVGITMVLASFGFAVMCARDGSMENV